MDTDIEAGAEIVTGTGADGLTVGALM